MNRPLAIAIHPAAGRVYWSESVSGRIRRAALDGGVSPTHPSGISSWGERGDAAELEVLGLAVDERDGRIYWTEMLDGALLRADGDGDVASIETVVDSSRGLDVPAGVAVAGKHVYWADAAASKIQRASLDGSGVQDVATAADGLVEPYAIAVDRSAGRIYWTDASVARCTERDARRRRPSARACADERGAAGQRLERMRAGACERGRSLRASRRQRGGCMPGEGRCVESRLEAPIGCRAGAADLRAPAGDA